MSVEKDIRYELLSRLCPNTTGERTDLHLPTPPPLLHPESTPHCHTSFLPPIPTSHSHPLPSPLTVLLPTPYSDQTNQPHIPTNATPLVPIHSHPPHPPTPTPHTFPLPNSPVPTYSIVLPFGSFNLCSLLPKSWPCPSSRVYTEVPVCRSRDPERVHGGGNVRDPVAP